MADRLVQRVIVGHLTNQAQHLGIINEVSYGFIKSSDEKKRGVVAARNRALQIRRTYRWAYKSDIQAFFDRIPRESVVDQVVRRLRTPSLRGIISSAANCEIDIRDPQISRVLKEQGIRTGLGVRQGMPMSPVFANVLLKDFDRKIMSKNFQMVRYADDFVIFCESSDLCHRADSLARKELAKIELCLPSLDESDSKTKISAPEEPIEFLGLQLSKKKEKDEYELIITQNQMEKIRRALGNLKDIDSLVSKDITFSDLGRRLEYALAGYRSAYSVAENYKNLERVLGELRFDIIREVLERVFGEQSVKKLKENHKRFMDF